MSDYVCFLIFLLDKEDNTIVKCALKCKRDSLPYECVAYPLEPKNRKALHELLPEYVRSLGEIIDVTSLFEITITE